MSNYRKSSTLTVRRVVHRAVMEAAAEVVVNHGTRVLCHWADEASGKLADQAVKKLVDNVRSYFNDHREWLALTLRPRQ
jgi:hypothetical protein